MKNSLKITLLSLLIIAGVFAGCGQDEEADIDTNTEEVFEEEMDNEDMEDEEEMEDDSSDSEGVDVGASVGNGEEE